MADEFTQSQVMAIAKALGDTSEGLTGQEIEHLLATARIADHSPTESKWKRLYNAFALNINELGHRRHVLAFIRFSMKPERYIENPGKFEAMRARLNTALAFAGLAVQANGELVSVQQASTLSEAAARARALRDGLELRRAHADVLRYCQAELVADNYFHAVLEATKSIAAKLRARTHIDLDGAALVDVTLSGEHPPLRINSFKTESERSEQRGFATLVKGVFSMFRNPTAHEARALWAMDQDDAEDLLSMVSLIHRRLDGATLSSTLPARE